MNKVFSCLNNFFEETADEKDRENAWDDRKVSLNADYAEF